MDRVMVVSRQMAAAFAVIVLCLANKRRRERERRRQRRLWTREQFRQRRVNRLRTVELVEDTVNFTRMTPEDFEYLTELIAPKIARMDTSMREAITVKERLGLTLRFLATGDSYTRLQNLFSVSKSAVSLIIPETCNAIVETLREYVKVPSTEAEWLEKAREFEEKWSFPHAIAAMDGRLVMLKDKQVSIVLFALVDANYNFIYVNTSCQDRTSDASLFKNTMLYDKLEHRTLKVPLPRVLHVPYSVEVPYMILGDKSFTLNDYTVKPFDGTPETGSIEHIFNYRHSRACHVVENAFGVVSSVFRVLRKPMLLKPDVASKVTLATIYLHNFLRRRSSRNIYTPPGTFDIDRDGEVSKGTWRVEQGQPMSSLLPIQNVPRRTAGRSRNIRSHLANHFALNDILPWQSN